MYSGISIPESVFNKGQILLVSVVDVDPSKKRLILALDKKNGKVIQLSLGSVYTVAIESVVDEPKGLIAIYNKICKCFIPVYIFVILFIFRWNIFLIIINTINNSMIIIKIELEILSI